MDDPADDVRDAGQMALRVLLGELWEEVLLRGPDPIGRSNEIASKMLTALDAVADTAEVSDMFKHAYLHEMESFWSRVRDDIRKRHELAQAQARARAEWEGSARPPKQPEP